MKILKTGFVIFCSSALLMMSGCASSPSSDGATSLTGSKWHYTDADWQYDIEFAGGGVLRTTHPNDKSKDNDTWEQDGNTVNFYFNNKFSTYNGTLSGNQLSGSASNKNGAKWTWKATKAQ
jgi:outer membrane biogenesis lipoprotein LolB